jgi:hypothetical protein
VDFRSYEKNVTLPKENLSQYPIPHKNMNYMNRPLKTYVF